MPTIRKRGPQQWQAIVKKMGINKSSTFMYKADAEKWARKIEREIDEGKYQEPDESASITLKTALSRYGKEVTPLKKGKDRELARISAWKEHPLAKKHLNKVTGADLATYRDDARKSGLSDATIRLELMLISALYTTARKDWGFSRLTNPVANMTLPATSKWRERRISELELRYLFKALPIAFPKSHLILELNQLALETGMRQSEILGITWDDVHLTEKYLQLDKTKSDVPRSVPLSPRALDIMSSIPNGDNSSKIFKISQDRLIRGFRKACRIGKELAIENQEKIQTGFLTNLKFHDLRHESASRWASIFEAQELCKFFGWKTMQMAIRYYHPTPQSLAEKMASVTI